MKLQIVSSVEFRQNMRQVYRVYKKVIYSPMQTTLCHEQILIEIESTPRIFGYPILDVRKFVEQFL